MRLLLDSHTFLWFIRGDPKLSGHAREAIEDVDNERLLSTGSLWELSIKASLGKLRLNMTIAELVREHVTGNAMSLLTIRPEHLDVLVTLPFHHKDPFDRLLIAQALTEGVAILGKDRIFDAYGVERVWKRKTESDSATEEDPLIKP